MTSADGISIHALREEGDLPFGEQLGDDVVISIHALREEGDGCGGGLLADGHSISIHALREEGDLLEPVRVSIPPGFLSTPSARRATSQASHCKEAGLYFYPRPPRGGRPSTTGKEDTPQ